MTLKLTPEERQALSHSNGSVPIEDEETHHVYYLVDGPHRTDIEQQKDLAAIREGIADVQAGYVAPLDDVIARIRTNLGLRQTG
jgi:hypothetical protein